MVTEIFVFGSNLAGRHGAGAARHAYLNCGAQIGVGVGRTGNAYAVPTKDERLRVLPIATIAMHVADFIEYTYVHPELTFKVTRVGCGLAGYRDVEIAPLFLPLLVKPRNCTMPAEWVKLYEANKSWLATAKDAAKDRRTRH